MLKKIINSILPLSHHSIQAIEALVVLEEVSSKTTFIKKNKPNSKEYFVLEGVCRSYLLNPEGEDITISFFTSNSILSPHTMRTKNELSVLNFQALTDLKLAAINAKEFEKLMMHNLEIRDFGNTVLRNELAQKVDKEIGLASLTAKERLLLFREQYPMLENRIPHPYIASYLGITNVSLSRLRKKLTL